MKNRSIAESFNNAINGIIHTIRHERNMKLHVLSAAAVIALSIYYGLNRIELIIVCITAAIVLICELFNTALEALVDVMVDKYHPQAKIIKDVAAGAVLLSALVSLIVGYFIFYEKLSMELEEGIKKIRQSPEHLTLVALAATVTLVLLIKALSRKGTPFKGGMPSGHSAIAFSITTSIALWTGNASITILCLIVSLLVVQSRLEGKIHSIMESVAGALLGFLVTLLLFQLFTV